jgi:beta-lactam-binding protein with PASTA domain
MRICQSCGRENADDVDFCACGEYLRWEPTNYQMPAIPSGPAESEDPAPEPPAEAQERTTPPPAPEVPRPETRFVSAVRPAVRKPPPPPAEPARNAARTLRAAPAPEGPPPGGARRDRVPPPPETIPPAPPPRDRPPAPRSPAPAAPVAEPARPLAGITLRLPDDDPNSGAETLGVAVVPGNRARVLALVRNQDAIVDNYTLDLQGLPRDWYTIIPETVYLVPFGSAGAYEQEVEIHIHPPRTPEAEARRWDLSIGVASRAHGRQVAAAPLTLGIHPYEDYAIRVRPERGSGRRRAKYDVAIANNANAVVLLALDAHDTDDECEFEFERETVELGAHETRTVGLRCRPPRQIWLGRPLERRFEVACASGDEGEKLLREKAQARAAGGGGGLSGLAGKAPKLPGVSGPKVNMPNVGIGPGGNLDVRMPHVRGPQFQGVNLRRPTLGLRALRAPDRVQAPQAPQAPLLPKQAIFRQKPWLPWWLAIVVPLLLLLGLLLLLLLPKNVEVPNLKGAKTAFDAEKQLIAAGLVLGDKQERPSREAEPGTVIDQSPAAGESAKKGSPVTVEIAVSTSDTIVPTLAGKTLAAADKALRRRGLTKGALNPQPSDPKLTIASTLPAAGEQVKEGTPVDIFFADPKAAAAGKQGGGKPGVAAVPGGGGSGPKEIEVPEIDPADQQGYGAVLAKANLVPGGVERRISDAPRGTVVATDPAVGTKLAKGAAVKLIVSAGFPRVAFDNEVNVLLADAGTGRRIPPAIAKSALQEKDPAWSADGKSVVYTIGLPGSDGGRLVSADMVQRGRAPSPLRPASEKYADPSFAPITTRSVLAVSRVNANRDRDICFGRVRLDSFAPQCIVDPRVSIGFAHWSPNGRRILALGTQPDGRFGIVQYTSKRPFSARRSDWRGGGFVTRRAEGRGVIDAAISPDGKRLAAVANLDTPVFQLYLTTPGDIELRAKPLPVPACKVMWIDSENLALVKLGESCDQDDGEIVRINVNKPTESKPVAAPGDNPAFQPLAATG